VLEPESVNAFSYVAAFAGGLISFASPCVLPVVPGYLSVVTGLDFTELSESKRSNMFPVIRDTSLFVAGFGGVFVLLGLSATTIGRFVFDQQLLLTRISGGLVLGMALFMLASLLLKSPWLYQEKRFHPELGRYGRAAPTVAGAAFGFGWTPCIGPVLTSVLAVAATSGRATTGGTLLAVYSLGLGIPFLLSGLLLGRLGSSMKWVKSHMPHIIVVSSVLMAIFGLLLIFNQLIRITTQLQSLLRAVGLEWLVNLG